MTNPAPPPLPRRLYANGDIHGHADLLDRMIELIGRDLGGGPGDDCLTVALGDYIDRGPASRAVVERLVGNPFPTPFLGLKGNHEALLDEFLVNPSIAADWRQYGGLETMHSYGVDVAHVMIGRHYEAAAEALAAAIPPAHAAFFASLRPSLTVGRYFLCHAGVRPGIALDRQDANDLLWIRDEFLDSRADFGRIVVHGHSPVAEPEIRRNRINIDTGAFMTGRLTCAVLEDEHVRFLSAF